MSDFEHPNGDLELNLSQEELKSLRNELAGLLIKKGTIIQYEGVDPVIEGQKVYGFSYLLDKQFVRDTFFPEGDVIPTSAKVSCTMPYNIEPGADDAEFSFGVEVIAEGVVANEAMHTDNRLETMTHIVINETMHDGHFAGYHNTEYSIGDERVSPNDLQPRDPSDMSIEDAIGLLDDLGALEHDLTIDDAETLHKIISYIATHPKIDD